MELTCVAHPIPKGIKLSVQKDPDAEGEVSNFGALTTALAATIGTGNIVGVGTAIALGGPGAVLWCWLSGIFFYYICNGVNLCCTSDSKRCESCKHCEDHSQNFAEFLPF